MTNCTTQTDICDAVPRIGEVWSICLPFGGRIWADGNGVHAAGGIAPPDGVYGKVVIANGCIIGVEPEDVPLYTGSPCAPLPGDCGSSGGAGGGMSGGGSTGGSSGSGGCTCDLTPSSTTGNQFTTDAAGRPLVRVSIKGADGITVTGNGTTSNPYVISNSGGGITVEPVYITSGNAAITVTGTGSRQDPFVITHKEGTSGTVNGMKFDSYGHFIGAAEGSSTKGITGIVGASGIQATVDKTTGVATISLTDPPEDILGTYTTGGYNLTFDAWGRLYEVGRAIDLGGSHEVTCGDAKLTISPLGSIVKVESGSGGGGGGGGNTPTEPEEPVTTGGAGNIVIQWNDRSNTPVTRQATFNWPADGGLMGWFYVAAAAESAGQLNQNFWNNTKFYIDNTMCDFHTMGVPLVLTMADGTWANAINIPPGAVFWTGATVAKGSHTIKIELSNASERACAVLSPLSAFIRI